MTPSPNNSAETVTGMVCWCVLWPCLFMACGTLLKHQLRRPGIVKCRLVINKRCSLQSQMAAHPQVRTCAFFNGSLSMYQLGSQTLGRVNEEDAEKGLVYWDVFKSARLDNLKARHLDEGAAVLGCGGTGRRLSAWHIVR